MSYNFLSYNSRRCNFGAIILGSPNTHITKKKKLGVTHSYTLFTQLYTLNIPSPFISFFRIFNYILFLVLFFCFCILSFFFFLYFVISLSGWNKYTLTYTYTHTQNHQKPKTHTHTHKKKTKLVKKKNKQKNRREGRHSFVRLWQP